MEKGRILLMFGMSIRKFIILSALIVSGCISHPETIDIDFDSGTEDYTPLVRKILAEHPAGEVTIRFGAGTFDFYPEQAAGSYLCVSNNDNGYKRCAFLLEEMRRVRIEGAGEKTQLRFHGAIVPFRVARCFHDRLRRIVHLRRPRRWQRSSYAQHHAPSARSGTFRDPERGTLVYGLRLGESVR